MWPTNLSKLSEDDMLKDTLNMVAQAVAIYAVLIGGYWIFIG
jgi:hypothetical protein